MDKSNLPPAFVSVVTLLLGAYDLLRGFMHTILLHYSATHIAGLDLSSVNASDQLRLLGAFGMSNLETGAMLILAALHARKLALAMLGIIPLAYFIGYLGVEANSSGYPASQAQWCGLEPMLIYLVICVLTFGAGVLATYKGRRKDMH